jgi:hypothetical protein
VAVRSSSWVEIPLPRGWLRCVKSAVLHVVSLARFATIHTRGWAADSLSARLRLKASLDEARSEVALCEFLNFGRRQLYRLCARLGIPLRGRAR